MEYANYGFKAPEISKHEIQEAVNEFRDNYWRDNDDPIDLEMIIERELRIAISSIKNLKNELGIDAFISRDFKIITIDYDVYMKDIFSNRRRFSFGHELGHYILHKVTYGKFQFENLEEYKDIILRIPDCEYRKMEFQASVFSGKLLVPKEHLIQELKNSRVKLDSSIMNQKDFSFELMTDYIYSEISKTFMVSCDVIRKRIESEEIDIRDILN